MCIQQHTCVCPQQQLVGQALILGCNRQLTSSETHVRVLTAAIGLPKLFKVQNLHLTVCVLTAAVGLPKSLKESKLQLTGSAPDMCIFRNAHVYANKQQLVGQPLTLECNPQWTASETHTRVCVCVCVFVCAHSSNWSAKVVGCSEPSLGSLIELFCKTDVCVFTAAIGRLTLN